MVLQSILLLKSRRLTSGSVMSLHLHPYRRRLHRMWSARGLLLSVLGNTLTATLLTGQTHLTVQPHPDTETTQTLPTPLVTAAFPEPTHAVDWGHYQHRDECVEILDRVAAVERYNRFVVVPGIDRDQSRDTTRTNPWAPLSVGARDSLMSCLHRFPIATVPAEEASFMLRFAIQANDDSAVFVLIARKLAAVQHTPANVQAGVLDTLVRLLMSSPALPGQPSIAQPSAQHLQWAQRYAAQLQALGSPGLTYYVDARTRLMEPATYAGDLDALLKDTREELAWAHQLSPADVRTVFGTSLDTVDIWLHGIEAHQQWMQTGAPEAFQRFLSAAHLTKRISVNHLALLGTLAPPVTGEYCFATPTTTVPTPNLTPAIPALGAPSLIVFDDDPREVDLHWLRRLHEEFPEVNIALVSALSGEYLGRRFKDQPVEEAKLRHHELADSLGIPGSLCVTQPAYQKLPNGQILPTWTTLQRTYDLDAQESGVFLVDAQGHIIDGTSSDDVYTILRRLQRVRASAAGQEPH